METFSFFYFVFLLLFYSPTFLGMIHDVVINNKYICIAETSNIIKLNMYTKSFFMFLCKEYEDVKFVRLGKSSRIHSEILRYSDGFLSKEMKTLEEIEQFYMGAVRSFFFSSYLQNKLFLYHSLVYTS